MNSVANTVVATLMNSNYGVNRSTSVSGSPSSNGFSEILNKSQAKQLNKEEFETYAEERVGTEVDKQTHGTDVSEKASSKNNGQKSEHVKVEDEADVVEVKDEKPAEEVTNASEDEKLETLKEAIKSLSETEKTSEALEERLSKIEDLMIDFVSQFLGISQDELQTMMNDMGMTPLDLMQMKNISTLVADFYGIDSFSELLVHEDASAMIKEMDGELESLLQSMAEELDMNVDELKGMLEAQLAVAKSTEGEVAAAVSEGEESVSNLAAVEKSEASSEASDGSVKLEVQDGRTEQDTTKYSQDNTGKEDQSFANILSNNTNVSREVIVNNGEQVVYKQINPNEVIDQIVTKAVVKLTDTNTTMQMQLNPGHLGKIAVSVTAEQGMVKGQFVAESQVVKEMLEANLGQLKTQLEEQGIKVDKIEVTVGNSGQFFEQNKEQQHQQPKEKANRARINRLSRMRSLNEVVDSIDTAENVHMAGRPVILNSLTEHTVDYSA